MPHTIVEYSANLEADLNPVEMISVIHRAVLATGIFEPGGVRTRAERRDVFMVADGDPENAFIHVTARIGPGRTPAAKKATSAAILAAIETLAAEAFASRGLGISIEIAELDDTAILRKNNLHERLKAKQAKV